MKLGTLAKLIRSKNAGPFILTIDIILGDKSAYEIVKNSEKFNAKSIADLYRTHESDIHFFYIDLIYTIKISFNRAVASGDLGDTDVFGGQQHGPLVDMEI